MVFLYKNFTAACPDYEQAKGVRRLNRKILISGLSILSALTVMGAATFAYFSDANSSIGNTFTAGNLDLQLDDVNDSLSSGSITASIGGTDLAPGATVSGFISVHNAGSVDMAEVVFGADQTAGADSPNLADVIDLTVMTGTNNTCTEGAVNQTNTIALALGNNTLPLTLSELVTTNYDALPGLTGGSTYYVCISAQMETGSDDTYQGDSATVDFIFKGNQDVSQT